MTNSEILNVFNNKYPELKNVDYRPLCPEIYTNNLVGITMNNYMVGQRGRNTILSKRSTERK